MIPKAFFESSSFPIRAFARGMQWDGVYRFVILKTLFHECFVDAAKLFAAALRGPLVIVDPDEYQGPPDNTRDVLFGWQSVRTDSAARALGRIPKDNIALYETENLLSSIGWNDRCERQRRAFRVRQCLNYSAVNAERGTRGNGRDTHCPIPFVRELYQPPLPGARAVDVLFYGSINDTRFDLLEQILGLGLSVLIFSPKHAYFGEQLHNAIDEARVVLNLHYYEPGIFEAFRCVPAFHRGALIVSEPNAMGEEQRRDTAANIIVVPRFELLNKLPDIVRNSYNLRNAMHDIVPTWDSLSDTRAILNEHFLLPDRIFD
jgi:hypothetical protein